MVEVSCHRHPKYKGKIWPKVACKWCAMIYVLLNCQKVTDAGR